jgi:malate dehydrogenase (oxaloacetate-decarboxylating)
MLIDIGVLPGPTPLAPGGSIILVSRRRGLVPGEAEGLTGVRLLGDPILNKGTAFSEQERTELHLHGLLPPQVETLDQQVARAYRAFARKDDDLERHIYLRALQDTNEVLFYRLLFDHLEEMIPIVYTPVVALGCQQFSQIYRRSRGLFVSYGRRDGVRQLLQDRPRKEVDVIVVTDGERILGTGDQGVGGMGISIGKLALYSLLGGIHPARTLPVVLDVGTNNEDRLADPEYLGERHPRVTGDAYFDFVHDFVEAVKAELPGACLQWEDFSSVHAFPILERYRGELLTFNDDIQGTAAVTLGALLGAIAASGGSLKDQEVVILGGGSASLGVAQYLERALASGGLGGEEARRRLWILDIAGLFHDGRTDLTPGQRVYAQPAGRIAGWTRTTAGGVDLLETVTRVRTTILIGLSTAQGAFTEAVVREVARKVERPIIFPLSNPTARSEAQPADLVRWTGGRVLMATGSPFAPVTWEGRVMPVAQCNNAYIFPAVGLGLMVSGARRVTDGMLAAAGQALSQHAPVLSDPDGAVLPPLRDLRRVAVDVAVAVGARAGEEGVAPPTSRETLQRKALAGQWMPAYPEGGARRGA